MLPIDDILIKYLNQTLADETTLGLEWAVLKLKLNRTFLIQHPLYAAQVTPQDLDQLLAYVETQLNRRYGCDGMTPISP